jgi:gamma-glutamylcyclotransferase (GGCT)/AIG2-like uncharacterized protein YtfP
MAMTLLFSYGSLQERRVQLANFRRELAGRADSLPSYTRRLVTNGESTYANAEATSNPEDAIDGMAFEVTEQELVAADRYEETASYRRILVTLRSGDRAWVYVHATVV